MKANDNHSNAIITHDDLRRRNKRARIIDQTFKWISIAFIGFAFFACFTLMAVNALEKESKWEAQRLCKYYGHCDQNGGR